MVREAFLDPVLGVEVRKDTKMKTANTNVEFEFFGSG